jgi:hypothetical protein
VVAADCVEIRNDSVDHQRIVTVCVVRHLSEIRMTPMDEGKEWHYVAEGTWNLLGTGPNAPVPQITGGQEKRDGIAALTLSLWGLAPWKA